MKFNTPKASNHQAILGKPNNRPSYVQALEKAMETLWTPEAVRQTRELAEQIHLNNQERAA